MKLISCHIDQFGCLQNFDYTFQPGLNTLLAPNGFGKTTLAAFLRAMFYGFPRSNSRGNLEKNPRKKYTPWQGGAFGGWLRFEANGHFYEVHRTFSNTPVGDTFRLLEDGKPSNAFDTNLGQALFGLEAESFERCVYLPQAKADSFATGDIHARLAALVYNTDDLEHYETAMKRLQSRRGLYRHYRGNGGLIAADQEQVYRLERELTLARQAQAELAELETQLEQLQLSREELLLQQQKNSTDIHHISLLEQRLAHQREILDALEDKYPQGLPEAAQLETFRRQRHRLQQLQQQLLQLPEQEDTLSPAMAQAFRQLPDPQGALADCGLDLERLKHQSKQPGWKGLLILLGMFLLIGGVALSFLHLTLGLGISAAALVLTLFALLKKPSGHREQQVLARKIRHFLASFPLEPADPEKQLSQLRQLYPVFRAEEEKRSYRASLSAQVQQLSHQLPENLSQLEEDSAAYETALHQWELCRGQLAQAQRQGDPDLQSKLTRLQTSIDDLRRRQFSLENQAASLTPLEDQLAEARDTLQEHRKHCDLLDLAIQLLEQARENLSQSYLDPVQQHFDRYARQLLSLAEASLDEELNPTIGRHALGYFSPGYADSIRLCMHLALTDSLFPGEKPPLILDDPFVNLDEENLCRAKEILNTLSQSRQILHLTCHESRA